MNEVYIDIRKENEWIKKYFDTDLVSINKLVDVIENLDDTINNLKEQIKELQTPEEPDDYVEGIPW